MDGGIESLDDDGLDVLLSGRESTVMILDVSRDICVEPEQLPVVVSKEAVELLAVPVVVQTRPHVGGTPDVAWPVNVDVISWAEVDPDLLYGRVMQSVDPDVGSGDRMSLNLIPDVDGDACHTEWRETVVDDIVMEKFVLVPEVCPVGSMTSVAGPTFLPTFFFSWGGGGGSCCGKPPGGGRVRYSASVWPAGGVRYSTSVCPASCPKRSFGGLC